MRRPLPLALSALVRLLAQHSARQSCIGCLRPSPAQPCRNCELECRATLARRWHISRSPALSPLVSLYYFGRYANPQTRSATALANALRSFKYAGNRRSGHALCKLLEQNARMLPRCFDAVGPIPLHRSRMASRGFNQSAWLARAVAKALDLPLLTDALQRCDNGPAQASLGARERRRHGQQMFAIGSAQVAGKRVLLVDDVYTTGTTLRSAASVLCRRGRADAVSALVLLVAEKNDEPRRSPTLGRKTARPQSR